jgi:hypothetical protein
VHLIDPDLFERTNKLIVVQIGFEHSYV